MARTSSLPLESFSIRGHQIKKAIFTLALFMLCFWCSVKQSAVQTQSSIKFQVIKFWFWLMPLDNFINTRRNIKRCKSLGWHPTTLFLASENSPHFAMPSLLSPQNDVWETSAEIPHWWRVTTKIWVLLLIGRTVSSVWNFCARFSYVILPRN